MNTQDILNTVLILGLIAITTCIIYITYYFVRTLKSITEVLNNLEDVALGIKEKLQVKALAAIPAILLTLVSKLIRRRR